MPVVLTLEAEHSVLMPGDQRTPGTKTLVELRHPYLPNTMSHCGKCHVIVLMDGANVFDTPEIAARPKSGVLFGGAWPGKNISLLCLCDRNSW